MINYYIYAKDYSYSTNGVAFYHDNGLQTLNQFKSEVNKISSEISDPVESRIIYLHWGHECLEVDEKTTVDTYKARKGNDNHTWPETIIEWMTKNIEGDYKLKLIYIITDGLIGTLSLNKCLQLNENRDYEKVVFHGFHMDLNRIDLSVASSFLKSHCTIYRNNEKLDDVDISEQFDYDKITTESFATEKENLKSYIKLKYINSSKSNASALTEIDQLKKLRTRLFNSLSIENNTNIDTKDKNIFIKEFMNTHWYKNFSNPSYDLKIDIERSICTLINYIVSDKKSYAFDALKFDTHFRYDIPEEPIADVNFAPEQEIEFPDIILDDEKGIPVILCTELNLLQKIIFHASVSTASFSKFKSTMECPLFLLKDPELNDSIGYFYTLNVYKQLLEKTTRLEPRTRRPFHGGIVLTDTDKFDKYNDYVLSATYFNFKKVKYNVGLFYFVLWKICEKKKWMDQNVVEQFKKYMLRRVSTQVCKVGLSSLPLDPQVNTFLPTALWYCVELSSQMFKDDPQRFTHERLRMYYSVADRMIEILKYFNYDLDFNLINKRKDLISHVMTLKKISPQRDRVLYLVEKIFEKENGFVICNIENPGNIQKLNYLKVNHKGMLNDNIVTQEVNLNNYVHFLDYTHGTELEVQICEKTYRPFFMIDQNRSFYSEVSKVYKKVVINNVAGEIVVNYEPIDKLEFSKILSLYNLFIHCVKDSNKFPSLEEYTEYILKKRKFKDNLVTIFAVNTINEIKKVFLAYECVTKDVQVSEFISVCNKYVSRVERIKAEDKREFDNDDKIREYILNEECKNNLKRSTTQE